MIKHHLIAAFALLLGGCAGMQPTQESDRNFEAVYEAPGASKEQIFKATKMWIAENFNSAKAVIEYENLADGTLIGNSVIKYPCVNIECLAKGDYKVPFTMRVDMKDQKFKLTFSNIRLVFPPSAGVSGYDGPVNLKGDMDAIRPRLLALGNELAESIKKGKAAKDW